jgi:beta-glucosidase
LNTGDPVLMPWASKVRSILEMWYPGQEGGPATADLLLGNVNPGGKLPVTFPADATKIPTYDAGCTDTSVNGNCPLYPGSAQDGHGYRTITALDAQEGNGIFQGYRWYDRKGVEPLFPFGHGLSYTQFKYSKLDVRPAADGLDVSFLVRNVGPRTGDEVTQVYVGAPANAPVPMADKSLAGFERITLAPGHAQEVTVHVAGRSLSYWSVERHGWVKPSGTRPIYVGSSSRDVRLQSAG